MQYLEVSGRDVAALRREYEGASPFPHLVFDDLVALDPADADRFPDPDWDGWSGYGDTYQAGKTICSDIQAIPSPFRDILRESGDPAFLRFLEAVTGIERLIPDPYLHGGGLHASGPGGVLMPHTDFHLHPDLGLYRQLNLLIYLNRDWSADDGGCLELFGDPRARRAEVQVVPALGRAVLFRTDDRSVHGFPRPVAAGRRRASIAVYYYTSEDSPEFAGDVLTYWRHHDRHRGVRRVRDLAYRGALTAAKAASRVAYGLNPNRS